MHRRTFLHFTAAALAAGTASACAGRVGSGSTGAAADTTAAVDAAAFHAARRYADTGFGRIAYVERGRGEAALFLHGAPLNGFQWRGALARLHPQRRCIAPDFMGLGYSEPREGQSLAAVEQAAMLVALLDRLGVARADVVASDSGCAAAQWLLARHPERVRSALLCNGDVEIDSPPAKVRPAIEMARAGTLAGATAEWLTDKAKARATLGAAAFTYPERMADATIDCYAAPVVATPLRRAQYHAFHLALEPNPLAGIEAELARSTAPARIVWGDGDDIFAFADAQYLDRLLPQSRGIRRVPGAKLFFPEEFPDLIADEALRLWRSV